MGGNDDPITANLSGCTVSNNTTGISMGGGGDPLTVDIYDTTISYNTTGISLGGGSDPYTTYVLALDEAIVEYNTDGITMGGGSDPFEATIEDSKIRYNDFGIIIDEADSDTTIYNTCILENEYFGVWLKDGYLDLSYSIVRGNSISQYNDLNAGVMVEDTVDEAGITSDSCI
ncbi:MAG: hypothetical protein GY832_42735, partial [Chloroflexi bacterium]|nr:hypothetical protein [Chloroflexota bacterium]